MGAEALLITRVELCGRLTVDVNGEARHACLPGRQGRTLFAFLVANRARGVSRDELMGALWPDHAPAEPAAALRTVLARTRQALGPDVLHGRHELGLRFHHDAWIDLEAAEALTRQAESALRSGDAGAALEAGRGALALAERPLLPEFAAPWVEERRRDLEETLLTTLELNARAGLALGGTCLAAAERAARSLVARAPFRESGYGLLMQIAAARGDVAEALRVFDDVRVLLREELGAAPSPALIELNTRCLTGLPSEPVHDAALERADGPLPVALTRALRKPFVGRREHVVRLRACWAAADIGPRVVAVTGEAGIGKTSLVAQFASEANAAGATVLYGRSDEQPLGPAQPFVEAFEHLTEDGVSPDALRTGIPAALSAATSRGRVLLILDDMQWADDTSRLLLRHTLRSPAASELMVIVVMRDLDITSSRSFELIADLRREHDLERLSLEGFDADETEAFIDAYGVEIGDRFDRPLRQKTAGNPAFLREALRWLESRPHVPRGLEAELINRLGASERARELVLGRLARLGQFDRNVVETAAAATPANGADFRLDALQRTLAEPAERLLRSIETLMSDGLVVEVAGSVDRFSFRHPLVRDALRAQMSGSRRIRLGQCYGSRPDVHSSPARSREVRSSVNELHAL